MLEILEKGVSEKIFQAVLAKQPEWLKLVKSNAWETFSNLSVDPTRREKFKDVIDSLDIESKYFKNTLALPSDFKLEQWGELSGSISLNSDKNFLNEELAKKGVLLKSLKSALTENEDLVKPYLTKSNLTSKDSRFTALAEALWEDGIFFYVPKDVEVTLPIHFLKYATEGNSQSYYKTLVVVENGSKVTIIDEFNSKNTEDFFLVNGVNEIHVKDNANVTYIHLQNFDYNAFNFSLQKGVLGKDSKLQLLSLSLGSQFSYENIRTYMESGSDAEILGLVVGSKEQVFQHETLQYHAVPSANSDLHFEVMLKDSAESAHNGFVQIEKVAQKSSAHQLIRNLLLSRNAKAEAIPNLEILADDVKCSHGVSLGPVSSEELFYLNSRGFSQEEAENFIIEGNIEKVINKLVDTDQDEDDEVEEDMFVETTTLATRVRDYILSNLS